MHTLHTLTHPLPTPEEMRLWDAEAVVYGLPELLLMENAARAALAVLQNAYGALQGKVVLLFMGNGNNGGDAACLARHLQDMRALPLIIHTKAIKSYRGVTGQHLRIARRCGVPCVLLPQISEENYEFLDTQIQKILPQAWRTPDILVDGLLGTGFSGSVRAPFVSLIRIINTLASKTFILALDVPSGCNAVTGKASPIAVRADVTVCFAAAKPGLVLPTAKAWIGKLFIRHIGIPHEIQEHIPASFRMLAGQELHRLFPPPPQESHKNTWGHVLVIGGSAGITGAAHLTAKAALRAGAGLVTVAAPSMLCREIKGNMPDIMTLALGKDDNDTWPTKVAEYLQEKIVACSAIALGPGMGTHKNVPKFLEALLRLSARPRAVIDADALNVLAQHPELLSLLRNDDILTPHPGEAARLLNISSAKVQNDRVFALQKLTSLTPNSTPCWILKGAATLLAQGKSSIFILPYDISALAIAGSGDILTGCTAALGAYIQSSTANGKGNRKDNCTDTLSIAALAMLIHAKAGHMAAQTYPMRGHTASDLVELLPLALAHISASPSSSPLPEVYYADHYPY